MAILNLVLRLAVVAVLFAATPRADAQTDLRLAEQDIKAGLLYNFLRYTDFGPARDGAEAMVVCVYGPDPFGGRLERMEGRTVNQRRIDVRAARSYPDAAGCNLVFVSAEQRAQWPLLRDHLAGRRILTVSDFDGFSRSGGMIEFTRERNRVSMRINIAAVEAAHLGVHERLLRLASVVRDGEP